MKGDHLFGIEDWDKVARNGQFKPSAMATIVSTSLRSLERFFARAFGMTPTDYARRVRVRLARELAENGWSKKAIAADLHFTDSAHLCHELKTLAWFGEECRQGQPPDYAG